MSYKLNILLIALFLLLNTGCRHKTKPIPSGVINKETMVNVMVDVNLAEAALRVKNSSFPADSPYVKAYYNVIYKKYGISAGQFKESLKYYTKQPDKFGEIYDEVLSRLNRIQTEESSKK